MESTKDKKEQSVLYILPTPISDFQKLSQFVDESFLVKIEIFIVENLKPTRQVIKKSFPNFDIDSKVWIPISKKDDKTIAEIKQYLKKKICILMSDCGAPSIADPGYSVVRLAHESGVNVKPLIGPSSIFLALMSSGLNGQYFEFIGYFPIKEYERKKILHQILMSNHRTKTYICIETPYRNNNLFKSLLELLPSSALLCVAQDILGKEELIKTMPVSSWKKYAIQLKKFPTVFLFQK